MGNRYDGQFAVWDGKQLWTVPFPYFLIFRHYRWNFYMCFQLWRGKNIFFFKTTPNMVDENHNLAITSSSSSLLWLFNWLIFTCSGKNQATNTTNYMEHLFVHQFVGMKQKWKLIPKQHMTILHKCFQSPMWNILRFFMEKKMTLPQVW